MVAVAKTILQITVAVAEVAQISSCHSCSFLAAAVAGLASVLAVAVVAVVAVATTDTEIASFKSFPKQKSPSGLFLLVGVLFDFFCGLHTYLFACVFCDAWICFFSFDIIFFSSLEI